MIRTKKNSFQT